MKILIVGSDESYAIERIYHKYLVEIGHDVDLYPLATLADKRIRKSLPLKVLRKMRISTIYNTDNKLLIRYVTEKKPEVIWVFKGIEILTNTLIHFRSLGFKIVNYNPDHPFIRTFSAGGGNNVADSVPLYDLHFCYSLDLCREIENRFHIPCVHLPFGFELDDETYQEVKMENEILKVAFVGNPDKYRKKIIQYLAENHIAIDVYGYGWDKWLSDHKYITVYNGVEKKDFWKSMRRYRVNLNIFRPHNEGSHNMRTFEIPAVGGIMLAPQSKEHIQFFTDNEEFFTYTDQASLIDSCHYLLHISTIDANRIRNNARNRCVNNDYSYRHNAAIVSHALKELI